MAAKHDPERFRAGLIEKKRELWNKLREEYFTRLGKEYNEQFSSPQDVEDLAVSDLIEETGLTVADIRLGELEAIEKTIERIDDGTYGKCEDCGEAVDGARLSAMPYAARCLACQSKRER
ncbi:MAG: TraR/DksA family transcriptional regulator [Deltaproteobacteria bacterium]|nr:TraR/DksA family transcriptional regulator [Deltaproteobacteria bacterium]